MQATFSFHHLLAVEVGGSLKFFDHVFLDYTLKKAWKNIEARRKRNIQH